MRVNYCMDKVTKYMLPCPYYLYLLEDYMGVNYNKQIEIRDLRNGSWFWIQTHIWRDKNLTNSDKVVYGTIASYVDNSQISFPSVTRIALDSGISVRQVYNSIKKLKKASYIDIESNRGKPNVYKLLKTTPATIAPLQPLHTTPAKNDSSTPAKYAIRTIKDITISNNNILPKGNGVTYTNGNSKEYGDIEINYIISAYKKNFGFTPTDKYPRRSAHSIRQNINSFRQAYTFSQEQTFEQSVDRCFEWYKKKYGDFTGDTLDTFRRKVKILLEKSLDAQKGSLQ